MAVTLERISGKGKFRGHKSNLGSYTVREDSTPLLPTDSTGGAGTFDIPVTEVDDSVLFLNNEVRLSDPEKGYTAGIVRSLASDEGEMTLSADSRLAKFVVTRTAAPVGGTLGAVLEYYFSLVGIDDHYLIDPDIASRYVTYPAWTDDVWTRLKNICVAQQIEISLVSGNIVVRKPRGHTAHMGRNSAIDFDINTTNLAAFVEVNYYNYQVVANSTVYPIPGETPSVITLGSEEEVVVELQTNTSLTSIIQPSPTTTEMLEASSDIDNSSYYIVHDGTKELSVEAWEDAGGSVSARIDPDDNTRVILFIRGGYSRTNGTYRIGFKGMGDTYANSLHIAGTGVQFDKRTLRTATGANPALVVDDQAQTIDNPAVSTLEEAWRVAADASSVFAGPQFSIEVSSNGIHRGTDLTSFRYLTATEFNAEYAGMTFDDFNAEFSGMTMDEFNAIYEERFEDEFENQAFGNVNGARVEWRDNIFRIRSATLSENGIDYTAERDIMAEDFNAAYAGMTMDEFNELWAGYTFDDFAVIPLRRPGE